MGGNANGEPLRPRLADLAPPDPALPPPIEPVELEVLEAPGLDVLLSVIAGELGIIVLLLVGTLLAVILRS